MSDPVVITSTGILCSMGWSLDELRETWRSGASGIRPLSVIDEPWYPVREGGEVVDLVPRDLVEKRQRKHLKVMTRPVRIGLGAARAAWIPRAALTTLPHPERRAGFVGAGLAVDEGGDFVEPLKRSFDGEGEFSLRRWAGEGIPVLNPLWLIKGLSNNVLAFASQFLDLQGVNDNFCEGESAGLVAVGEALWALREDTTDIALAGGYGTYLTLEDEVGLLLHERIGTDNPPGEGGAFFVLEREGDARAAGATPLATVRGFGTCAEGGDPLALALDDASLARDDLDRVLDDIAPRMGNAHGGHAALMLAVALTYTGERVAVQHSAPGEVAAAMIVEVAG